MGRMTWLGGQSAKDKLAGGTFPWLSSLQGDRSWICDQVGALRSASLCALWPGAGFPEKAVWIQDCLGRLERGDPPQAAGVCICSGWYVCLLLGLTVDIC